MIVVIIDNNGSGDDILAGQFRSVQDAERYVEFLSRVSYVNADVITNYDPMEGNDVPWITW